MEQGECWETSLQPATFTTATKLRTVALFPLTTSYGVRGRLPHHIFGLRRRKAGHIASIIGVSGLPAGW